MKKADKTILEKAHKIELREQKKKFKEYKELLLQQPKIPEKIIFECFNPSVNFDIQIPLKDKINEIIEYLEKTK